MWTREEAEDWIHQNRSLDLSRLECPLSDAERWQELKGMARMLIALKGGVFGPLDPWEAEFAQRLEAAMREVLSHPIQAEAPWWQFWRK